MCKPSCIYHLPQFYSQSACQSGASIPGAAEAFLKIYTHSHTDTHFVGDMYLYPLVCVKPLPQYFLHSLTTHYRTGSHCGFVFISQRKAHRYTNNHVSANIDPCLGVCVSITVGLHCFMSTKCEGN